MAITLESIKINLSSIIEQEPDGTEIIILSSTEDTRKTVVISTFVELFGEADFTYESLTQEKYEDYRYKQYFDVWKEEGLLE